MAGKSVISGRRKTVGSDARKALRIDGIEEIQDNLNNVLNAVTGKEMKRVMMGAGLHARDLIREFAPQGETGNLKRAVFAAYGDDNKSNILVGVNHRIAPHANNVEFGHAGPHAAGPHPFFRPGLVRAAPKMKDILETGFKAVIENAPK